MTQTFGQLDGREARNARTRNWLNAEEVRPGGNNIPPDLKVDVPATIATIRQVLSSQDNVCIDVQGDVGAVSLIRAQLTPDESARVQFSSRQEP